MVPTTVVTQCLELSQTLANLGYSFSINIKVGNTFTFQLDTSREDVRKKISPSKKRRSEERKRKYLESRKPLTST